MMSQLSPNHARFDARAATRSRRRGVGGFSLVEVIVALALFGISMSAIGALTFAVTRQSTAGAAAVERAAALEGRVNDLFSIPWTAIDARVGCVTVTSPFARTECITVTTAADGNHKAVRLTVTPADTDIDPVSVTVQRTRPPAANPFKVAP